MDFPNRPTRYPTYIPVIVTHSGTPQSAYIVDINAYGACVAGVENLSESDIVHLRGAVETSVGTVRWGSDDRIGVYFERPILQQSLAMLRLRGMAQPPVAARAHICASR